MLFKIKVSWANILFTEYFTHAMFHGNEISTCFARRTVYLLQLENMLCLRRDLPWYYNTRGICYTWGERGICRSRKKVKLFLYMYSFLLWSMSNVDKNNNGLKNALSTHIWVYLTGYYGTCYRPVLQAWYAGKDKSYRSPKNTIYNKESILGRW